MVDAFDITFYNNTLKYIVDGGSPWFSAKVVATILRCAKTRRVLPDDADTEEHAFDALVRNGSKHQFNDSTQSCSHVSYQEHIMIFMEETVVCSGPTQNKHQQRTCT